MAFAPIAQCLQCGKEFEVHRVGTMRETRYCSPRCGQKAPKEKIPPIDKNCINCGNLFNTGDGPQLRQGRRNRDRKYCSRSCAVQYQWKSRRFRFVVKTSHQGCKKPRDIRQGFLGRDGKYVPWARVVAEKAMGRMLKSSEVVHHIDGDKMNDSNSNLLVCDNSYHHHLHTMMSYLYQREHFADGRV